MSLSQFSPCHVVNKAFKTVASHAFAFDCQRPEPIRFFGTSPFVFFASLENGYLMSYCTFLLSYLAQKNPSNLLKIASIGLRKMIFYVEIILQNKQHSSWDSKTCQREVFDERYDMELQHRRVKVKWRPPFWAAVVVKTCRLTSLCGVNDNRRYHSSQEEEGFWSSASFYSQKFRYRHNKKDLNHLKEDTYFFSEIQNMYICSWN